MKIRPPPPQEAPQKKFGHLSFTEVAQEVRLARTGRQNRPMLEPRGPPR